MFTGSWCVPFVCFESVSLSRKCLPWGSLKYLECFEEAGEREFPLPLSRPVAGKRTHPTTCLLDLPVRAALLFPPPSSRPEQTMGCYARREERKAQTHEPLSNRGHFRPLSSAFDGRESPRASDGTGLTALCQRGREGGKGFEVGGPFVEKNTGISRFRANLPPIFRRFRRGGAREGTGSL